MKSKKREVQVFSMSFLDVLSCALGGTLLLLLLMQEVQNETVEENEPQPPVNAEQLAELEEQLEEETRRREAAEAERRQAEQERDDAREQLQDNQATKFWVLSIHVTQTRDVNGQVEAEDFNVNYYVSLNIDGTRVTGQMFGVQDIDRNDGADSFGQARIKGTRDGNDIVFDLIYEGAADGDIERVTAVFVDADHIEGDLSSVASTEGHRGYEGPLKGVKLTP